MPKYGPPKNISWDAFFSIPKLSPAPTQQTLEVWSNLVQGLGVRLGISSTHIYSYTHGYIHTYDHLVRYGCPWHKLFPVVAAETTWKQFTVTTIAERHKPSGTMWYPRCPSWSVYGSQSLCVRMIAQEERKKVDHNQLDDLLLANLEGREPVTSGPSNSGKVPLWSALLFSGKGSSSLNMMQKKATLVRQICDKILGRGKELVCSTLQLQ